MDDIFKQSFMHIQHIGCNAVYDTILNNKDDIILYLDNLYGILHEYKNGHINNKDLSNYCKSKNYETNKFIKSVPMSRKMIFSMLNSSKTKPKVISNVNNVEIALTLYLQSSYLILTEILNKSKQDIDIYNKKIMDLFDSYVSKPTGSTKFYLDDYSISEMFKDELDVEVRKYMVNFK